MINWDYDLYYIIQGFCNFFRHYPKNRIPKASLPHGGSMNSFVFTVFLVIKKQKEMLFYLEQVAML